MVRVLIALVFVLASGSALADDRIRTVTLARGLEFPWSLAFLPNGDMLVTERAGRLRLIHDGALVEDAITGVPDVFDNSQGGLFDVVLHPDFETNRLIYLSYASGNVVLNRTTITRARLSDDGRELEDADVIFRARAGKAGGAHYGGRMIFLPDGTLLLTIGEGFIRREQAQDPDNHFGSIVRLNDDGSPADGNPFAEDDDPAIWTIGHRNPQGIAIEPTSGEVWAHEHGPQGGDEVNHIIAGANYGWPERSNGVNYNDSDIANHAVDDGFEQPLAFWTPSIAPSGMAFYTGEAFPEWTGDLFVGALAGQHLRRLDIEDGEIVDQEILLDALETRIRDVRDGPDGFLYVLTDDLEGSVLRLEPAD